MTDRRSCVANPSGHLLWRWTNSDGTDWACCAYDHGPFCRLCTKVDDDILDACLAHVEAGLMYVRTNAAGTMEFQATAKGKQVTAADIARDPKLQALWDRIATERMEGEFDG